MRINGEKGFGPSIHFFLLIKVTNIGKISDKKR